MFIKRLKVIFMGNGQRNCSNFSIFFSCSLCIMECSATILDEKCMPYF
uniref:Uncharacterized protein n=1 Tax=Cyprinodon variegatus TaxID=28743 RepID=A0A3Q2GBZ1_CYPVA